jgi:hypothetical protein
MGTTTIAKSSTMESESDESDESDDIESEFTKFNALCKALRRNDPDCTEAAVIYDLPRYGFGDYDVFCPYGYGPRLGQALNGNEFVQTLELNLEPMLGNPVMDRIHAGEADGVLDFLRRSASLRTVKLRTTACRDIDDGEALLVKLAFTAVAENPHGPLAIHLDTMETELGSYPIDVPPQALADALRATKSLEELVIWLGDGGSPGYWFDDDDDDDDDDCHEDVDDRLAEEKEKIAGRALLSQAFGDNTSLKRLHILDESCEQSVAALVDALRQNASLISVTCQDFTKIQLCRTEMYCTRNHCLNNVLAELGQSETEAVIDRRKVDWLPILPTIFAVMKHAPRSATGRMLQCLVGLANELGSTSRSRSKRTRMQR